MPILSLLVQIASIIAGIYIAYSDSILRGITLVLIVSVMHWIFYKIATGLAYFHQLTLSESDKMGIAVENLLTQGTSGNPLLWKIIAYICCLFFVVSATAIIYWFLIS
jgi:hypothetical protein